jgi:hypothetical protein
LRHSNDILQECVSFLLSLDEGEKGSHLPVSARWIRLASHGPVFALPIAINDVLRVFVQVQLYIRIGTPRTSPLQAPSPTQRPLPPPSSKPRASFASPSPTPTHGSSVHTTSVSKGVQKMKRCVRLDNVNDSVVVDAFALRNDLSLPALAGGNMKRMNEYLGRLHRLQAPSTKAVYAVRSTALMHQH